MAAYIFIALCVLIVCFIFARDIPVNGCDFGDVMYILLQYNMEKRPYHRINVDLYSLVTEN